MKSQNHAAISSARLWDISSTMQNLELDFAKGAKTPKTKLESS
ncbi:hypothetical protein [Helicobacter macacae]|nr:hypothetical protein [Helicobacter macacae]